MLMSTYQQLPVSFNRGEGVWLYTDQNEPYLDGLSGIAVCGLGHAHPEVTLALTEQASQLMHTSNIYHIKAQEILAEQLCSASGMSQAYFCNSGAEANETAIKIARMHAHQVGVDNPQVIVAEQSFHGRTLAMLSATGNRKIQAGFEPLVSGFLRVPYNDINSIEKIAASNQNIAAVFIEPIQGEGGINIPDTGYLSQIRQICTDNNWLMILDEIQTGIGRTGSLFNYQQFDILPDVLSIAKGLGNGFPIGACLASGSAKDTFQPGNHGSTFGGNPLACKVASKVLEILQREALTDNANKQGNRINQAVIERFGTKSIVRQVRQQGLMIGIELDRPCSEIVGIALEQNLLLNVTAERVIRLLPPLIINDSETIQLIERLIQTIAIFTTQKNA